MDEEQSGKVYKIMVSWEDILEKLMTKDFCENEKGNCYYS